MSESYIVAIASSLTAIFAIIAPVIVAIINNRHTKNIKEIELIYEAKINAFKEFLSAYGKFRAISNYPNLAELGEMTSKAMLYANPEIRNHLQGILSYIASQDTKKELSVDIVEQSYDALIPLIYDEINKKGS